MINLTTCKDIYGDLIPDFIDTGANPLYALSLLISESANAELRKILVDNYDSLTLDYLLNRYDKIMSPLFMRLYEIREEDLSAVATDISKIINTKFVFNWNKLAEATFGDYNPIENYNMIENKKTDFEEHTVTDNTETVTNSYTGFNADDMKPVSKSETEGNIDSTKTDTGTSANNELTRHGNIGVTTSQQMIESSYKLAQKNILDIIYRDIDSILFIDYYK